MSKKLMVVICMPLVLGLASFISLISFNIDVSAKQATVYSPSQYEVVRKKLCAKKERLQNHPRPTVKKEAEAVPCFPRLADVKEGNKKKTTAKRITYRVQLYRYVNPSVVDGLSTCNTLKNGDRDAKRRYLLATVIPLHGDSRFNTELATTVFIESLYDGLLDPQAIGDVSRGGSYGWFQMFSGGRLNVFSGSKERKIAQAFNPILATDKARQEFSIYYADGKRGAALAYAAQRPRDYGKYSEAYNLYNDQAKALLSLDCEKYTTAQAVAAFAKTVD